MNYDISQQYGSFITYFNINSNLHNDISNINIIPINTIPSNTIPSNTISNNSFRNILLNNIASNYNLSNSIENELIRNSFQEKPIYKKIITENAYNNLKKIVYNKNNNLKNNSCPIYCLDFEDGEEITMLPCEHCFTSEAIKKWLFEENNECPVCRTELEFQEVKIENQTTEQENNNLNPILENNLPAQSSSLLPQNNFYPILENNNHELQNIMNNIYNTSYSNTILQYLRDYVNNNENNNENDNQNDNEEDYDEEEENQNNNNTESINVNNNIRNILSLFEEQLRNTTSNHYINYYEEEIYSRDLEEAIARSLENN